MKIRLAIIDDHQLITDGFENWYKNHDQIEVVYTSNSPKELLHYLNNNTIDVILTDLNMPEMTGVDLVRKVKERNPNQKIAALTMYYNQHLINELNALKIDGFIHKNYGLNELTKAILEINKNGSYFTEQVSRMMIQYDFTFVDNSSIKDNFIKQFYLSKRELEIFELIIRNNSSSVISEKLFISEGTVSAHRKNIMKKTNCSSALELLHLALDQGLYKID